MVSKTTSPRLSVDLPQTTLPDAPLRVAALSQRLGITFHQPALLLQALLHRSAVLESEREGRPEAGVPSNERLEFLGDAVLNMLMALLAFRQFTDYDEGRLTAVRTALVRRSTMAILAESIGLGEFVYMGRAEAKGDTRGRATVLAEAMEAVLGAIFLDQGLECAERFLATALEGRIDTLLARADTLNPKSQLQEFAQARLHVIPQYFLLSRRGPDHDSRFEVEVRMGDFVGRGEGSSKQGAEQQAARTVLALLARLGSAEGDGAAEVVGGSGERSP
jgi:ribonuclease-3